MHKIGQTYQGRPTACTGTLQVRRIVDHDNLLNNVKTLGQYLRTTLEVPFRNRPTIGDIPGRGLFWGVKFLFFILTEMLHILFKGADHRSSFDFVDDEALKEPFDPTFTHRLVHHPYQPVQLYYRCIFLECSLVMGSYSCASLAHANGHSSKDKLLH